MVTITERMEQVATILRGQRDGIAAGEVAKLIGLSQTRATEVLRALRAAKRADVTSAGRFALWGTPYVVKRLRAGNQAAAAQAAQRRAAQREAAELEAVEAFANEPLTHHTVPAAKAAPLSPAGPASVFQLANPVTQPRPRRTTEGEPA